MKDKINILNSKGGRSACNEQEAPSNDQPNFHWGRWVQIPIWCIYDKMKSSFGICSMYGHVFSWATIIVACVIIINVIYTIYVQIELAMMTSIKVQKSFLIIRISTRCQMWWGKRWETSLWTCDSLSKIIVVTISQNVWWAIVHLVP
jgi:hypothetical protein